MTEEELRDRLYEKKLEEITYSVARMEAWIDDVLSNDIYEMTLEDIKTDLRDNEWATEEELK